MLRDRVLLGVGRHIVPAPGYLVHHESNKEARKGQSRLAFMTPDHHRVRDFAVRELPRGAYLTLQQAAGITPATQRALFAFGG